MGLLLNGVLAGETFEDKQVTVEFLLKTFPEIAAKLKQLSPNIRFDLDSSKKKKKNGQEVFPIFVGINYRTSGTYKGDSFELIYFETRSLRKDKNNSYYVYLPTKGKMTGGSMLVNVEQKKELAVFLMISSQCASSPIIQKGKKAATYVVDDPHERAEAAFAKTKLYSELNERIVKDDINVLRAKAQGMHLGDMTKRTDSEVRMILQNSLLEHQVSGRISSFSERFHSPNSVLTGLVREAVQRGVLVQFSEKGSFVYKWGEGTSKKGIIMHKVNPGRPPLEDLIEYCRDNYDIVVKALKNEINQSQHLSGMSIAIEEMESNNMGEKAKKRFDEMTDLEIVEEAFETEMIAFDRKEKCVFLVKAGDYDGDPLVKIENASNWKSEFADFVSANKDVRTKILQKVQAKRNLQSKSASV